MKKYILPSIGGLGIVIAATFASPLAAYADSYVPTDPCANNACVDSLQFVADTPSDPVKDPGTAADPHASTPGAVGDTTALATTGSSLPVAFIGGAGAAIVLGGATIVVVRRKARKSN